MTPIAPAGFLRARELAARTQEAVLTCSALRALCPDLRFVPLSLPEHEAQRRVGSRPGHIYPPALVASQFAALQDPGGEPGVVTVDACLGLHEVVARALQGLRR